MTIIDSSQAMARVLASTPDPWLKQMLTLRRDQHREADCDLGDLGPIVIVEPGDALSAIEQAAGVPIATNLVDGITFPDPAFMPSWEFCEAHQGWHEIVYVTCDDGSGAVLFVPDRDGIDATLMAIIHAYGDGNTPT